MLNTRKQQLTRKRNESSVMVDLTTKQYIVSLSQARGLPQKYFLKEIFEKIWEKQVKKGEVSA